MMKDTGSKLIWKIYLDTIRVVEERQSPSLWQYDPDDIVLDPDTDYVLQIAYPVKVPYRAKIKTGEKGTTRGELVDLICRHYRNMYRQDEKRGGTKYGILQGNMYKLNNVYVRGAYINEDNDIILQGI